MTMSKVALVVLAVVLASANAQVEVPEGVTARLVNYTNADGMPLTGYLTYPSNAEAPVPGVIIAHQWAGLTDFEQEIAVRIANDWGYFAFAMDLYGTAFPDGNGTVPMEERPVRAGGLIGSDEAIKGTLFPLLQAALAAIEAEAEAGTPLDLDRLSMIGYCAGGTVSLEAGRMDLTPGLKLAGGFHTGGVKPATTPTMVDSGTKPRVVMYNGADDILLLDNDQYAGFTAEMEAAEAPGFEWELVLYGAVKHSFTKPGDTLVRHNEGNSGYSPYADARSWSDLYQVLSEVFGTDHPMTAYADQVYALEGEEPEAFYSVGMNGEMNESALVTMEVPYSDPTDGASLTAYVAYPAELEDKVPAVLIVPDWDGIGEYERWRARLLAEMGYVAMVVDYYSDDFAPALGIASPSLLDDSLDTTVQPIEPFQVRGALAGYYTSNTTLAEGRVQAALATLEEELGETVADTSMVAAIGYCFGGTQVLSLARKPFDGLKGVVAYHPGTLLALPGDELEEGNDVKVLVLFGADDGSVDRSDNYWGPDIDSFKAEMDAVMMRWEIQDYGFSQHGYTVPSSRYHTASDVKSWGTTREFMQNVFCNSPYGVVKSDDEAFGTIGLLIDEAGLAPEFSDNYAQYTLFVPSADAVTAALEELANVGGVDTVIANAGLVAYHVVTAGALTADSVPTEATSFTTLLAEIGSTAEETVPACGSAVSGAQLTVRRTEDGGVEVTDAAGRTANVVAADISACGSVIHVIDRVLLPCAEIATPVASDGNLDSQG